MGSRQSGDAAFSTYEEFARIYDDFNHLNNYEMWLGEKLLPELERRGLRTGRVLDVACGTGRAFEPLLRRGWEVRGCDISPAMLERARARFGEVELDVADMRELPAYGEFELALVLNDAVNYLTGDGELERALRAIRANLLPDGLLLFDCNSRLMYRLAYESDEDDVVNDGRRWTWTGLGQEDESSSVYKARIAGDGIEPIFNEERYFSVAEVEAALAGAGFECLAVLGQREEGSEVVLREPPDDEGDHKIVYIARPRSSVAA
jgi:SAM-dependent methyltransferase